MRPLVWVDAEFLIELHEEMIARSGGQHGVRDLGLLQSALARAPNLHAYEGVEDVVLLAATYAAGVSANHPFIDGNKRAAFMCMALFLRDNGLRLTAEPVDAAHTFLALASGELDAHGLAEWLRPYVHAL